ncbi:Disease resistance protein RUN1 [Linum perenne]
MTHVKQAMLDQKIRVFVDTMLQKTEDVGELLEILKRTAVSVVIFSEKFADSSWCLDEVNTIVQSIEEFNHKTLPVFYNVDWTTVAGDEWLIGSYVRMIAGLKESQESKKKWMESLKKVASKAGCTSESIPEEAALVKNVVSNLLTRLASMSSGIKFNNLVGIESRVSEVKRLLAMDDPNTSRIVGIFQMGGYGKSTLARACYEEMRRRHGQEMKFHFVEKINETSDKTSSITELAEKLYSTLLNEEHLASGVVNIGFKVERLLRLKVFVVLDDVQSFSQLQELLLDKALKLTELFSKGSRIIITTRNQGVLNYAKADMYRVKPLNDDESLTLFKLHAFEPGFIRDDRVHMSRDVVTYCQGNPLALKVLGCTLLRKDKKYWKSFLGKLGKIQDQKIHSVLRRSYDELGNDDKRLFLDIACFFYGTMRSLLVKYMDSIHPDSYSRVEDLINKSLLISEGDDKNKGERIVVHDLLREMAWNIVNEEDVIGKRSRLKDHDDINCLLTQEQGDRETQGIRLDLSIAEVMHLKANAFKGMHYLRWLDFGWPQSVGSENRKIQLSDGNLNSLPNALRGFNWDHFPCHFLPSGFSPKKLVYLVIRHSPIQICWEHNQPKLEYLTLLCLSNCENLTTIPSLSHCTNLEHILLSGCKTLTELPQDIQFLKNLVTLDARNCLNLELVPSKLNSKLLKQLLLSNCPKLTSCPKVNSPHLQALDCDGTPIIPIPNSIYKLKRDGIVSLYGPNITHFPNIPTRLDLLRLRKTSIQEIEIEYHQFKFDRLHLIKNTQLTTLPSEIWDMVSSELIIEKCPLLRCLPVISKPSCTLTTLRIAGCKKVTEFPSCICKLRCLEVLVFVGTNIKTLPSCISELKQLTYLDLSNSTSLELVPATISELGNLSELVLIGCGSNVSLPELLPPNLKLVKKSNSMTSTFRAMVKIFGEQIFNYKMVDYGSSRLIGNSLVVNASQQQALPCSIC